MFFNKILLFYFILSLSEPVIYAQSINVSGYVSDKNTDERLIGVNIYSPSMNIGTISNSFGFFSLQLADSSSSLIISYMGYKSDTLIIEPQKNLFLNIRLENGLILDEITVVAENENQIQKNEISVVQISMDKLYKLPEFVGENDIFHALQFMPGIQSGSEGKANLYIRGGSQDQNLIILDDVPLYNVSHYGGFLSTFNTDAIKEFKVYKGGFPARYGGRLSSVIDMRMKDGDMNHYHASGSIGIMSSKIEVNGPLIKEKSSFLISLRKNTLPIFRIISDVKLDYRFYDINSKLNYKINDKNRIYFSFYKGNDNVILRDRSKSEFFTSESKINNAWGNTLGSIRWNTILKNNLFVNTILGYTNYHYTNGFQYEFKNCHVDSSESVLNRFTSRVNDFFLRTSPEYYLNPDYVLRFGSEIMVHSFTPGDIRFEQNNNNLEESLFFANTRVRSLETQLYAECDMKPTKWFGANIGFHYSGYKIKDTYYGAMEPRLLANVKFSSNFSLKASYSIMQQYVHLLAYSGIGLPSDYWMPATADVPPQKSEQYTFGVQYNIGNKYNVSLETYRKRMSNLITFKPGESFAKMNESWEEKIYKKGIGISEGIECLIQKESGKTNGWIALDLSKSERRFKEIMNGEVFPFKYDRRFESSLVIIHSINNRISVSATWKFGTGYPVTLPIRKYNSFGEDVYVYTSRNSFRMRNYHRLDVGVNFKKVTKRGESKWNITILNVYNRQNPYFLYFKNKYIPIVHQGEHGFIIDGVKGDLKLYQQSLIPFFPMVSYSFTIN